MDTRDRVELKAGAMLIVLLVLGTVGFRVWQKQTVPRVEPENAQSAEQQAEVELLKRSDELAKISAELGTTTTAEDNMEALRRAMKNATSTK